MRLLLFLFSILAIALGWEIMSQAVGAIHEVFAAIIFLIGALFFCTAVIVDTLIQLPRKLLEEKLP